MQWYITYYSIDTCSTRPRREEDIVGLFYSKRMRNSASDQDIPQQHAQDGSRPTDTAVQPCVGLWSLIGCPTRTPSHQQPPEATNKAAPRGSAACDSPLVAPDPDYGSCGYPAPVCCRCPAAAAASFAVPVTKWWLKPPITSTQLRRDL